MQLRPIHGGETDPPGRNQDRKIKTGPRPIQDRRPDRTGPVSRGDPTDRKKIVEKIFEFFLGGEKLFFFKRLPSMEELQVGDSLELEALRTKER